MRALHLHEAQSLANNPDQVRPLAGVLALEERLPPLFGEGGATRDTEDQAAVGEWARR